MTLANYHPDSDDALLLTAYKTICCSLFGVSKRQLASKAQFSDSGTLLPSFIIHQHAQPAPRPPARPAG